MIIDNNNIIVITILASICDANTYVDVANWGQANLIWLKRYLALPYGIPSHDTFTLVFRFMDPLQFEQGFLNWVNSVEKITKGDVIAIDGKVLKGSTDKQNLYQAINMVSAWSALNNLILGQIKIASKSNEITAIPELLSILNIEGAIITIDAIGCQKSITETIVQEGAEGFENLSAIGVSENICTVDGETTRAVRFYILSMLLRGAS